MAETERFTVAALVRNQYGVLNRVTSMFRRRQFNIISLNVSETESSAYSRITVLFEGEPKVKRLLVDQLYKLPDVCSIQDLDEDNSINCEALLIKVPNESATRGEIMDAASAFGAKTVEYTHTALVFQMTDSRRRIDEFINFLSEYKILEICRTGVVSLERGDSTLRKVSKL